MLPRVSDINLNLLIMLIYKVTNKINGKVYVGVKDTRTIGKVLGFTPMIILIGGYLVAPLMIVSIMQMMSYFNKMSF